MKNRTKLTSHSIFWTLIFLFQFLLASQFLGITEAVLFSIGNVLLQCALFYAIGNWLFPRFFNNDEIRKFVLLNIAILITAIFLQTSFEIWTIQRANSSKPPHPEFIVGLKAIIWMLLIDFAAITATLFARINKENEVLQKKLSEEKRNTEIRFLKTQIKPHFLFNALDNIHSLVDIKSERVTERISKLSEMLHYIFDDCSKDVVTISSEIENIKNYMDLQQMKTPYKQNIRFETDISNPALLIAPMLFTPFIENSFTFSRIEKNEQALVEIKLSTTENSLHFDIINTFDPFDPLPSGAGLGIQNVYNRLKLLFPETHKLEVVDYDGIFRVSLEIQFTPINE